MEVRRTKEKQVEEEDLDCVRRMVARDASALEAFYERYNRLAFGLILRIVGNRADAEDVLVEAFWQVWQQASRFEPSRGKPVAWLLTIARTRAMDSLRSTGRKNLRTETFEDSSNATEASVQPEDIVTIGTRKVVREALAGLSEQQRTLLELAYFEGMTHTEIAAATGQPLGTVKDRIRTGMVHLRNALKTYV